MKDLKNITVAPSPSPSSPFAVIPKGEALVEPCLFGTQGPLENGCTVTSLHSKRGWLEGVCGNTLKHPSWVLNTQGSTGASCVQDDTSFLSPP